MLWYDHQVVAELYIPTQYPHLFCSLFVLTIKTFVLKLMFSHYSTCTKKVLSVNNMFNQSGGCTVGAPFMWSKTKISCCEMSKEWFVQLCRWNTTHSLTLPFHLMCLQCISKTFTLAQGNNGGIRIKSPIKAVMHWVIAGLFVHGAFTKRSIWFNYWSFSVDIVVQQNGNLVTHWGIFRVDI